MLLFRFLIKFVSMAISSSFSKFKAKLLQLKLIYISTNAILLMKKLEIEKTKPTFILSVLKVEY